MHILMTGAAGMIGRKLAARLAKDGALNGQTIEKLTLMDVVAPQPTAAFSGIETAAADIADSAAVRAAVASRPDVIFHLAGVVSGEAELDFEKGIRVNLDGARALFDAIRLIGDGYRPRLVFTSSIAVFGAPFPPAIADDFHLTPLTSYGTQKAAVELLLADYTRRGFLDGVGIRLPSIVVRPGQPNKAASGFFSSHHSRAARWRGGRAAGRRQCAALARQPARGCRLPRPCRRARRRKTRTSRQSRRCRASAAPWPSRSPPCVGSAATRLPPASAASPIRWSPASSLVGRAGSIQPGRLRSVSGPKPRSRRSSASILMTNWAARSRRNAQLALPAPMLTLLQETPETSSFSLT